MFMFTNTTELIVNTVDSTVLQEQSFPNKLFVQIGKNWTIIINNGC